MSLRSILLVAAALLLTVGTVFVARGWLESQRRQVAEKPAAVVEDTAPYVLVAKSDLAVGIFIKPEDLRWQAWPKGKLPDSYMLKGKVDEEDLNGTVVRRSFSTGEPITPDRIIKPGERGFLAAVLQAGFRAVSIPIGAASGIAGLVFPGDRVDILLTLTVRTTGDGEDKDAERRATETVMTNVRILAMDQKTDDQNAEPKLAKTVTLEVMPKQAEILAVVRELGSLSLSLRSLAKDEEELRWLADQETPLESPNPEKGKTYTWDSEASLLVPDRNEEDSETIVVQVARGKEIEALNFKKAR